MSDIVYIKRPQIKINRSKNSAVIRIDTEAAELLEEFATKSGLPVSKMASRAIKYWSENVIIKVEEEE